MTQHSGDPDPSAGHYPESTKPGAAGKPADGAGKSGAQEGGGKVSSHFPESKPAQGREKESNPGRKGAESGQR